MNNHCLCVSVLGPSLFPSREVKTRDLISECEIDQADFTFVASNIMEEISPSLEGLSANT